MIYFTSDTHFGHTAVIRYCHRPFETVQEMDEEIIRRWNETVGHDDIVFHLGDVSFRGAAQTVSILRRLNGFKFIVRGNHDRKDHLNRWQREGAISWWYERYWTVGEFILSHVPMYTYEKLLCGHVHTEWKRQRNTVNVGMDQWDYRPVGMEQINNELRTPEAVT